MANITLLKAEVLSWSTLPIATFSLANSGIFMRLLTLLCLCLLLSACASRPPSMGEHDADRTQIDAHQADLAAIESWQLQSRLAFFDLRDDSRQSASLRWQYTDGYHAIRLSHPLRGTLARLEEGASGAVLTDNEGRSYPADDIESLLAWHLNLILPIDLINDALLGRIPDTQLINPQYYANGTLAEYSVDFDQNNAWQRQTWHVSLDRYQNAQDSAIRLPHQLELQSEDYRIRLNITQWQINL